MADIRRYPLLHHFRCGPTDHVVYLRRGKVVRSGTGLSFWFRPLSAALSEVPVADRELPLLFHARTADMQDVTVRAAVAFRFEDPALAARRLDFGIDPGTGTWRASPLENVAATLTALSQQHAHDVVGTLSLREVLAGGVALVRERVAAGLADGSRLRDVGIVVSAVQIIAIRPEPDAERALETPALELIHQEADRARFERRALAVERERAISENELQSQIELATREEQLVAQRGANERRRAGEEAAAGRIKNESDAERTRLLAAAKADSTRLVGAAEAEAESQRLDAYARLDRDVLLALAARELAGHLPEIGSITVTPDLLASALARLGGPAAANGSAAAAGGSGGRR